MNRRASARDPIRDDEVPYLEALGAEVRGLRELAGFSMRRWAELVGGSMAFVRDLERGVRRTRRSTLTRLVRAYAGAVEHAVDVNELVDHLVAIAGHALADESAYRDRVEGRRKRRERKTERRQERAMTEALAMAKNLTAAAIDEHNRTGRWPEWVRRRVS